MFRGILMEYNLVTINEYAFFQEPSKVKYLSRVCHHLPLGFFNFIYLITHINYTHFIMNHFKYLAILSDSSFYLFYHFQVFFNHLMKHFVCVIAFIIDFNSFIFRNFKLL